MTGWAVLDVLGVGIAVLLLAWTSLLYVPFRWRPVGCTYSFPSWPPERSVRSSPPPALTPAELAGAGRLDWLVGGTPSEMPDRYARLSPVEHVHPGCPPALLVHGEHDEMAPVDAMRQLQRRLEQAGVPVTAVYLPQTEHGFDVLATAWSPPARTAIHVLERILAVLAATDQGSAAQPISGSRAEPAALPEARSVR
jgi:acetyl esterase/lipase